MGVPACPKHPKNRFFALSRSGRLRCVRLSGAHDNAETAVIGAVILTYDEVNVVPGIRV